MNTSRVGNFTMSRRSQFEGKTAATWKEEFKQIIDEVVDARKEGVDIIPYREDTETNTQDADKRPKGSAGDDVPPVAPQEGVADGRKDEKNVEQGG